jgi:hypothetical protein
MSFFFGVGIGIGIGIEMIAEINGGCGMFWGVDLFLAALAKDSGTIPIPMPTPTPMGLFRKSGNGSDSPPGPTKATAYIRIRK